MKYHFSLRKKISTWLSRAGVNTKAMVQRKRKKSQNLSPEIKRQFMIEALEDRLLLSGTSQAVANALVSNGTTIVVTTLKDTVDETDELISLREAIAEAKTGDIITFKSTLSGGTITLSEGELVIEQGITIDASSLAKKITINANNKSQVFSITEETLETPVQFIGLTITGGNASYGGGILNYGTLSINNCVISKNTSTSDGGGILNYDGTLTIIDSTVSGNTSTYDGAGIYNYYGTLMISNGTISQNTSSNDGGGVFNYDGVATITNSTISGNKASYGGGILNEGEMTISDSVVTGNSSTYDGGGGYVDGGTLTIINSTISTNTSAYDGSGVYCDDGNLTITNSTVSGNVSSSYGGGVYVDGGTLTMTNSTVSGNTATYFGGGIFNYTGDLTLTSSTISGNTASQGGGIFSDSGKLNLTNCTFSTNSSTENGGGVYFCNGKSSMVNNLFFGNTAANGGGIFSAGKLTITNNTISGNTASNGGGILSTGTLTVVNSIVSKNYSKESNANIDGVISPNSKKNLIDIDPHFKVAPEFDKDGKLTNAKTLDLHLSADSWGINTGDNSAVTEQFDLSGNPRIYDDTVDLGAYECQKEVKQEAQSLTVTTLDDLFNPTDKQTSLREAIFFANEGETVTFDPSLSGQTIALSGQELSIEQGIIIDASNLTNGITIHAQGKSRVFYITGGTSKTPVQLIGVTITGGKATHGGGVRNYGTVTIKNATISGNTASNDGGGISNDGTLVIEESIITGNKASSNNGNEVFNGGTCSLYGFVSLISDFYNGKVGTLKGTGYLQTSELSNKGLLSLSEGVLTVEGRYNQASTGTFQVTISGDVGVDKERLVVVGTASIDGTLSVTRPNSFVPDEWTRYVFIQANQVEGQFSSYSGCDVTDPDITAYFGDMVMIVARTFEQEPTATFTYENTKENNRLFFNVLNVVNGTAEFRLYDPNGQLVFLTSAPESDPDFGDFGAFILKDKGTYTVQVVTKPDTNPEYDWSINDAPITHNVAETGGTISDRLKTPGAINIYDIDAKEGSPLAFSIQSITPYSAEPQNLIFTLRDPDGIIYYRSTISSESATGKVLSLDSVSKGGTWTLSVEGKGDDIASYQIQSGIISLLDVSLAADGCTWEDGKSSQFSVKLKMEPTSDVVVHLASSDPSAGYSAVSELYFTPENWNIPQIVTVYGMDKSLQDGDLPYAIALTCESDDPNFKKQPVVSVDLTNIDIHSASPRVREIVSLDSGSGTPDTVAVVFTHSMNIPALINDGTILTAVSITSLSSGENLLTNVNQIHWNEVQKTMTLSLGTSLSSGTYEIRLEGSLLKNLDGYALLGGTGSSLIFSSPEFENTSILVANSEAIKTDSYSVPTLFDYNGDGNLDLIVGEKTDDFYGKIRLYLNSGDNAAPIYTDYSYLQSNGSTITLESEGSMGSYPRFADLDGDGLHDLLVGLSDGRILLYKNSGTQTSPLFGTGVSIQVAGTQWSVGGCAAFDVVDWNNDGRLDLVVGTTNGTIHLLLNEGTASSPIFNKDVLLQMGDKPLTVESGWSSLSVVDFDGDGRKDILSGNADGEIWFYKNIGTDQNPLFNSGVNLMIEDNPIFPDKTTYTRPFVADYNSDGILDLLTGDASGLVRLYLGSHNTQPISMQYDQEGDASFDDTLSLPAMEVTYSIQEGCTVYLNGASLFEDSKDSIFEWDLNGDGIFGDAYGLDCWFSTESFANFDGSVQTIYLRKISVDGTVSSPNAILASQREVSPTISFTQETFLDGHILSLSLQALLGGNRSVRQWTVDWGDESRVISEQPSVILNTSHYYSAPNTYSISLHITDTTGQEYEYKLTSYTVPGEVLSIANSIPELLFDEETLSPPVLLSIEVPINIPSLHSIAYTNSRTDKWDVDFDLSPLELISKGKMEIVEDDNPVSSMAAQAIFAEGKDWTIDLSLTDNEEDEREIDEWELSFGEDLFQTSF